VAIFARLLKIVENGGFAGEIYENKTPTPLS
jgi:hypothetical protein